MKRKPLSSPPEVVMTKDEKYITETRSYKVITPLFGGGAEAGAADAVTVVRVPSIRGNLRFWWRATKGGRYGGDLAAMKAAEASIWGAAAAKDAAGASEVSLSLKIRNRGTDFHPADRNGNSVRNIGEVRSQDSYAAFPLRDKPGAKVIEDVEFDLHISYPRKFEADIMAALWAWETFGGIGARTRRGFGALACTQVNGEIRPKLSQQQVSKAIQDGLGKHTEQNGSWPKSISNVGSGVRFKVCLLKDSSDPIRVWRHLITKLQKFRQDRRGKFGTSKWPEAHSIRRITDDYPEKHRPPQGSNLFPRGQMGLPIVFQFKDFGEPAPVTLKGNNHDRLSSPLILRPVLCAADGAVGLAIVLDGPKEIPGGAILETSRGNQPATIEVTDAEAKNIEPLQGEPDVLQAFLDFL